MQAEVGLEVLHLARTAIGSEVFGRRNQHHLEMAELARHQTGIGRLSGADDGIEALLHHINQTV